MQQKVKFLKDFKDRKTMLNLQQFKRRLKISVVEETRKQVQISNPSLIQQEQLQEKLKKSKLQKPREGEAVNRNGNSIVQRK